MKLLVNLVFLLLLFCSFAAFAKSSDKDAPLHIEADQVEMREKDSISIYNGRVKISKGSLKISGDKITIQNKNGELHLLKISGQPATFFQLNDLDEEIRAQSNQMDYQATSGLLELKDNALLEKSQNRFSSQHIIYDTQKDIVKAGNNDNNPNPEQAPRVKITINPQKTSNPDTQKANPGGDETHK